MTEPRRAASHPERFIADVMLGRLARWLRILGYDTAYDNTIADDALIARALEERRWLLTRDGFLARRRVVRGCHTLLTSDRIDGQLRQLHRELQLPLHLPPKRGYRCADCNVGLVPISEREAAPLVPPFVADHYREFIQCPHCGRVFWSGTHWKDLRRRLGVLGGGDVTP